MSATIHKKGYIKGSFIEEDCNARIMKNDITIGDNIIKNSYAFNASFTGITTLSNLKYNTCGIRTYSGTLETLNSYKDLINWQNILYPKLGDVYTFSFVARGSGRIIVYFYGNSGYLQCAKVESSTGFVSTSATDGNCPFDLTPNWTRYWVRYTLKTSGNVDIYKHLLIRHMYTTGNPTVNLEITQPKLEFGNVATPWVPSNSDKIINVNNIIEDNPIEGKILYEI